MVNSICFKKVLNVIAGPGWLHTVESWHLVVHIAVLFSKEICGHTRNLRLHLFCVQTGEMLPTGSYRTQQIYGAAVGRRSCSQCSLGATGFLYFVVGGKKEQCWVKKEFSSSSSFWNKLNHWQHHSLPLQKCFPGTIVERVWVIRW